MTFWNRQILIKDVNIEEINFCIFQSVKVNNDLSDQTVAK